MKMYFLVKPNFFGSILFMRNAALAKSFAKTGFMACALLCAVCSAGEPAPGPDAGPEKKPDLQSNAAYLLDLAQVHARYGAMDQAEPLLVKAQATASAEQKMQVAMLLAHIAEQKKDFVGAAKVMEAAVAVVPEGIERVRAMLHLATLLQQGQNNEGAEKVLLEACKAPQTTPETKMIAQEAQRSLLGVWANMPGRLDAAVKDAEAAVAANPKDEAALSRLADIFTSYKADAAKASGALEKLAELRPDSQETHYQLLGAYRQSKQHDKAVEYCRKKLPSQNKSSAVRMAFDIGQLLLQSGKKDEAVAWMREKFDKPDRTLEECHMLSGFYQSAQMLDAAEETLSKGLPLSRSPHEKAGLMLRLATMAMQRKDFLKAVALLDGVEKEFKDEAGIQTQVKAIRSRLDAQSKQPAPTPPGK
jgi:tetratricopeptide (TPR) repeat protein